MAGGKRVKVTNWKKLQLKCFEMKQKNIMLDVEKLNQTLVKLNICAIFLYLRGNLGNLFWENGKWEQDNLFKSSFFVHKL